MSKTRQSVALEITVPATGLPRPEAANWFFMSHQGDEVQVLIGYIDAAEIRQARERIESGKSGVKLRPEPMHRLVLSMTAYLRLRSQANELFRKLKEKGVINEEVVAETRAEGEDVA